ncbi:MAG: flagellin [Alphaproteobacteria bacterium]|jgi:flagellin|uniref:Flagellin n=1 Tax=Peteryoungia algae TaxID=2919917 RepID=A0ABT0CW06_9HYPH|nr:MULTISPECIES: flagellin [unclassified Rhizobium]MBU2326388.1 flagellin [Alphaproteobacteria bacterium]MCC8931404.1 flagellin [Rhizobium sp. 'Codium 1']MCJ8237343.1 flagellin [Rhizobium sp. SSM4.3]
MTSIMTNAAAMAALQTLRSIDNNLETTQRRVSSGYRVETAADNAGYWSIATTMRSDNAALSTVSDALGLGAATVDTAYTALDNVVDVMSTIKAKLVAASEPGVDKNKINEEMTQLKNQLISAAQSASFSGENWLYNTNAAPLGTKQVVSSFVRGADGSVQVTTLDFDTAESVLIDIQDPSQGFLTKAIDADVLRNTGTGVRDYYLLDMGAAPAGTEIAIDTNTDTETLADMISVVDNVIQQLTDAAATLGAITSRIEMQDNFVSNLMDVIDKGIGRLVDADMNEESTRLKALQTQQQLGIQALSIANSSAEKLLTLFQR